MPPRRMQFSFLIVLLATGLLLAGCGNYAPSTTSSATPGISADAPANTVPTAGVPAVAPTAQPEEPLTTPVVEPTTVPGQPTPSAEMLEYLLPAQFPNAFIILSTEHPAADTARFLLRLRAVDTPATPGSVMLIAGGEPAKDAVQSNTPNKGGGALIEPITVRGQSGTIATGGFGYTVSWTKDGYPYMVSGGNLDREQIIAFANTLASVDLATWQARVTAAAQSSPPSPTELPRQAIDSGTAVRLLTAQITQDKLYDKWTNLDCLSFLVEQANSGGFDIAIHEKHGGACPGDPNTAPVVDRFRVTGDRVIFWLNPQGEYVDYEQVEVFREHR